MPDYEDHDTGWRARARFPQRLGPIARTRAEMAGVGALIGAAFFLAVGGVVGGDWNVFLIFPAFGIPDLLLAWYRWGRWKRGARWSRDLRATILLTGLTVYLAVRAPIREDPVLLVGVVGGGAAAAIWTVRVIQDRRR
jgi:hypothetical protein